MCRRWLPVAVLLVALALLPVGAAAHRELPLGTAGQTREAAVAIPDADIAWMALGSLPAGGTQHLSFVRPESGRFRARVLVGTRQANLRLNPWLALAGPGLPRPPELEGLLPEGEGVLFFPPPESRELEAFPQAFPWPVLAGASLELDLPAAGPYFLLVFDPSGQGGTYLLDTGYLFD